jgi:hypothetical protein
VPNGRRKGAAEVDDDAVAFEPHASTTDSARIERTHAPTFLHEDLPGIPRAYDRAFLFRRESFGPELEIGEAQKVLQPEKLRRAREDQDLPTLIEEDVTALRGVAERPGARCTRIVT